jgi:hypothetical protein
MVNESPKNLGQKPKKRVVIKETSEHEEYVLAKMRLRKGNDSNYSSEPGM